MNISIFCSAANVSEVYTNSARELAERIATGGHTLVWGGFNKGTMKVIADAAQGAGGRIVGISVEYLKNDAHPTADEMIVTKDLPERKATLIARADAIVVLPGGLGTLDEVTEVMELKKHNMHDKKIVFLNTSGFYDGFKTQLERMDSEGFLPRALLEFAYFANEPEEAIAYIEAKA